METVESFASPFLSTLFDQIPRVELTFFLNISPFPFIFIPHALNTAARLRPLVEKYHWFYSLCMTIFVTLISGTLTAHLLQLPIPALHSNVLIPTTVVIWYLVHFSWGDVVYKFSLFYPIRIILTIFSTIQRSRSIFGAVDSAIKHLPGSIIGALILGTVAGTASSFVTAIAQKIHLESNSPPTEIWKPTFMMKSAVLISAALYFFTVDLSGVGNYALGGDIPEFYYGPWNDTVRVILMVYLVAHSVLTEIFGSFNPPPINILEELFFAITGIQSGNGPEKKHHID
eukprot:TRINITY_DN4801_c0_g2_i1.p1 TRINITY_DN4801_c0_g2~~TRINITY_DN4801_c0_g2_i1.p1  ORF type:complete len:293 (+),score=85.74 TRINITY_DN4801_c0_g2_i1:22-879(+)